MWIIYVCWFCCIFIMMNGNFFFLLDLDCQSYYFSLENNSRCWIWLYNILSILIKLKWWKKRWNTVFNKWFWSFLLSSEDLVVVRVFDYGQNVIFVKHNLLNENVLEGYYVYYRSTTATLSNCLCLQVASMYSSNKIESFGGNLMNSFEETVVSMKFSFWNKYFKKKHTTNIV
jgi:hypothetical protein